MANPERVRLRQRHNVLTRYRSADDPELVNSRRDLTEMAIAEYVTKQLAAGPPLRPEQRDRLASLFRQPRDEHYDPEIDIR